MKGLETYGTLEAADEHIVARFVNVKRIPQAADLTIGTKREHSLIIGVLSLPEFYRAIRPVDTGHKLAEQLRILYMKILKLSVHCTAASVFTRQCLPLAASSQHIEYPFQSFPA